MALAAAAVGACTFPSFLIEKERDLPTAGTAGTAGTTGTAGTAGEGATGGKTAAEAGAGGSLEAGQAGVGGAAGTPGFVFDAKSWSTENLDLLGFALIGSATLDASGVALTQLGVKGQAGGLMQRDQLQLDIGEPIHVAMRFSIQSGSPSGDGLAFVFHNVAGGYDNIGSSGGGLGYGGLNPCAAIELDTAGTLAADSPAPHLAFVPECRPEEHMPRTNALGGDPRGGQPWRLTVDWEPESDTLDIALLNEATQQETLLSAHADLATLVGTRAFIGVTAASGEFTATHLVSRIEVAGGGLAPRALSVPLP